MAASPEIVEAAQEAGLHYTSDSTPGITRRKARGGFAYFDANGKKVTNYEEIVRINKLAIPPAYDRVWICPDPNGHLQATGFDARGRKQYRYHPRFREFRDENKFMRMAEFGAILPKIRERIDADLSLDGFPKEKVAAVVVYLLERSLIRIGNEEYAHENKSYGLTTMLSRHVKVQGQKIEFTFLGKSKIKHKIEIHDKRLARLVKRIQDLPGQELIHYLDDEGVAHSISSSEVNHYLHEITGEHVTAKDFRTWWGTLLAFVELAGQEAPTTKAAQKRIVTQAMKNVSHQLGNTPAICRKCYVHPHVVEAFIEGSLRECFPKKEGLSDDELLSCAEDKLIRLLKRVAKAA